MSNPKILMIVESKEKSKIIQQILGKQYIVCPTFGHVRGLSQKSLGIDVEHNFEPSFEFLPKKRELVDHLREVIVSVGMVYLASDLDNEGEAISWHLKEVLNLSENMYKRITFNQVTEQALKNAIAQAHSIDMDKVYAQRGRMVLDKLIGFKISPVLWKHIKNNLSAGRVQSPVLNLIVEKEQEIEGNTSTKEIEIIGEFNTNTASNQILKGKVKEHKLTTPEDITNFLKHCKTTSFSICSVESKKVSRKPPAPFITSSLQKECCKSFHLTPSQVMSIVQRLYNTGKITYIRTDSAHLSEEAQDMCKKYIEENYGTPYLNIQQHEAHVKHEQGAHEAIRPTHISVISLLSGENNDNAGENSKERYSELDNKIYEHIWKRTVASQMSNSISNIITTDIGIDGREEIFTCTKTEVIFDGFTRVYRIVNPIPEEQKPTELKPDTKEEQTLKAGNTVNFININAREHYTNPPVRYGNDTIISTMEKIGIGRPSTYHTIVNTLLEREYVVCEDHSGTQQEITVYNITKTSPETSPEILITKEQQIIGRDTNKFSPTQIGKDVVKFLQQHFSTNIMDYDFTAKIEKQLDAIEDGGVIWQDVVRGFYNLFEQTVKNLMTKTCIIEKKNNIKLLGTYNDKNIYVVLGRFGYMIQLESGGEGEKPKYVSLNGKNPEEIDIATAIELLKYPLIIGKIDEKEVIVKNGKYGLYFSFDNNNYALKQYNRDTIDTFTIENAQEIITNTSKKVIKKTEEQTRTTGKTIDDPQYSVMTGKYGKYIQYKNGKIKKNVKVPKDYLEKDLSFDDCTTIVNNYMKSPPKRPRIWKRKKNRN